MKNSLRFVAPVAACAALCLALGCGQSPPEEPEEVPTPEGLGVPEGFLDSPVAEVGSSTLRGRITHRGEPIVSGYLFFYTDKGMLPLLAPINADGTFQADELPEGEVQICVLLDPKGELPFPTFKRRKDRAKDPEGEEPREGDPDNEMPDDPPDDNPNPPPEPGRVPERETRGGELVPAGLPPPIVDQIRALSVPSDKHKLYLQLHKTYHQPAKGPTLKVVIKPGDNTHDIILP